MVSAEIILGYFVTGIIWGMTNAYMEVGSKANDEGEVDKDKDKKQEKEKQTKEKGNWSSELYEGVKMFLRPAFLIPFLCN